MPVGEIRVEPVTSRRELRAFIMFPFDLYRADKNWVPPLITDRFSHFDPKHNPFYQHADVQLFRALRDGRTVGTIAAIDDQAHPKVWNENVGFFGEFEVVDDYAVAEKLLTAARQWLAARGRAVMRGPMNLNINDECGLLIEGYDGQPVIMMTYNPPYYRAFLERYGLAKAKDLYAYKVDIAGYGPNLEHLPEQVVRVSNIARERYGVQMRNIRMDRLDEEVELIKPIHRQAWGRNWGAVPMTDEEYTYLVAHLRQVVDPELTYVGFVNGEPVGCFIAVPNYNEVAYHMRGRLFPVGWIKYLWYKRKIKGLRVLIMGVIEEQRLKGVEALFYAEGCRIGVRKGFEWAEMSWILEDNYRVRRGIENMGGEIYRRYRIYDLPIR